MCSVDSSRSNSANPLLVLSKVTIHADVAVQLPAVAPDSLAPTVEVVHMAGRVARTVLAGKADRVDMLVDIAELQVDNFRCALHPE